MKKILVLSASTGGGHNRAARALSDALTAQGYEVKIIDSIKFVNTMMDTVISKGYEKSALYTPKAYGGIYKISDLTITHSEHKINILLKFMTSKIKKLIRSENPDFIIGTHPFPMMSVSALKEKEEFKSIPAMSIITDYTTHSTWIQKNIDTYVVADEMVKNLLKKEGVSSSQVLPLGLPIEDSFLQTPYLEDLVQDLNLIEPFKILLMGGSFGAGNVKKALKQILKSKKSFQIVVVCGRNHSLENKLNKMIHEEDLQHKVKILGFTNKVNHLMSICDVLITKPGGLTTTEAIIKEIPMIVPFFIPGQEQENLDFLLNNGLCMATTSKISIDVIIDFIIENPKRLENIRNNMASVKKLHSASHIANHINNILNETKKAQEI